MHDCKLEQMEASRNTLRHGLSEDRFDLFTTLSLFHGCFWEAFYIFASCGLVVEIQIHLAANI